MRKTEPWVAGVFAIAALWAGAVQADGGKNNRDFVARPPSGPTDSRLVGKEQAPSAQSAAPQSGSPAKMDAAPGVNPPAAPQAVEEATPTPAVKAPEASPVVETQSLAAPSAPVWENRWFWGLLALLLLLLAAAVEYFGRKRDERLAAEEPDDAVKA